MRRTLCLAAAALVASVAALTLAPVTAATTTPKWFGTHLVVKDQGHGQLAVSLSVTNLGWITHTGKIEVTSNFGPDRTVTLTLKPGYSTYLGWQQHVCSGHYWVKVAGTHVMEVNDPLSLLGATTGETVDITVP